MAAEYERIPLIFNVTDQLFSIIYIMRMRCPLTGGGFVEDQWVSGQTKSWF